VTCERTHELFSDYLAGELPEPLRRDVSEHIAGCDACAELREAFGEVVDLLRELPVVEPSLQLADRVAAASWRPRRPAPSRRLPGRQLRALAALQAAAAIVMLITGSFALAAGPDSEPVQRASRFLERTTNRVATLIEEKDQLLEDLQLIQVVIETALESRIDRVGDRVDDYRRLLEERRVDQPDADEPTTEGRCGNTGARLATLLNQDEAPTVSLDQPADAPAVRTQEETRG